MPSPDKFIKGFNLKKILHFRLYDWNIQHNPIVRYHEYEYLGTLYYEGEISDFNNFKKEFLEKASQKNIIKSDYGNPYECSISHLRFKKRDSDIVVTFVGHAIRI